MPGSFPVAQILTRLRGPLTTYLAELFVVLPGILARTDP